MILPAGKDSGGSPFERFRALIRILECPDEFTLKDLDLAFPLEGHSHRPEFAALNQFGETLPVPLRSLLRFRDSRADIWYQALGQIEESLDSRAGGGLHRLPMLPTDIIALANDLASRKGAELVQDLRSLAKEKKNLLNQWRNHLHLHRQEPLLPAVAFPVVLFSDDQPVIVWETVFTGRLAAAFQDRVGAASGAFQSGLVRAQQEITKRFGKETDVSIVCPATHLFGLSVQGGSGSLAMWAALWLTATGGKIPGGAIALTGELENGGKVKGVGAVELKASLALSCGFPHVVIPSEDLDGAPQWMRDDQRIVGVKNCEDLGHWLLMADPEFSTRGRLFHFARGVVGKSALPPTDFLNRMIREDLRGERWHDTWRNLRRVVREGSREGRSARWLTVVGRIRKMFSGIFQKNRHFKIPRDIWLGAFRALLPESVFLLHAPLLLERWEKSERALVDRLYARFGHRLADQDLNLNLAQAWGRKVFSDPAASPWFSKSFRKRYPLLSWFLFSDPILALQHLLAWKDLQKDEITWRREIFDCLAKTSPEDLANPSESCSSLFQRVLEQAASKSSGGFKPRLGNLTPIDRRPELILKILTTFESRLSKRRQGILKSHFCAHIHARNPSIEDLELVEELLRWKEHSYEMKKEILQRCKKSLQMIRRCGSALKDPEKLSDGELGLPKGALDWSHLLQSAWHFPSKPGKANEKTNANAKPNAKPKANDDPRRTQVHALDGSLTRALLSLIRGEPAEGKELAFQFLTNPAWVLVRLVLEGQKAGAEPSDPRLRLRAWFELLIDRWPSHLGFRLELVRECLRNWAGRLTGSGLLPEPDGFNDGQLGLGFWSGFHADPGSQKVVVEKANQQNKKMNQNQKQAHLERLGVKAVSGGNPQDLMWLPYVSPKPPQKLIKEMNLHLENLRKTTGETGREVEKRDNLVFTLIMCREAWPEVLPAADLPNAWPKECDERTAEFQDRPCLARVFDQGLLGLAALWKKPKRFPLRLANTLATSRGFSPLALCYQALYPPRGETQLRLAKALDAGRLWAIDWERSLFQTIYLFHLWQTGQRAALQRISLNDSQDLLNTFLCRDLLKTRSPDPS